MCRFTVFNFDYNCFVTYNSDPLVIPRTDSYILYYAPNTTEGLCRKEKGGERVCGRECSY